MVLVLLNYSIEVENPNDDSNGPPVYSHAADCMSKVSYVNKDWTK